jgi:hypothetical protein
MPPARAATKWDPDPADPTISRWRENLRRGSVATGDAWFRALRRFCAESERTAQEFLEFKPKALRDLFMDFAAADERRGASGSYTAYTLKVAKNWLRFNGITPPSGVKVKAADRVFEETALSTEQLRAAFNSASPRERVAIALVAQSGVRPEVIGSFEGADGLRFRDLPELVIEKSSVRPEKAPMVVAVRPELSKASHRYITFIGAEGTRILVDYAQARLAAGERIGPDSAVFPPERADLTERTFVRTTKIGDAIRHAFRGAGLTNRPYVLRTTAASRFAEAENRGLVPHAFWQHWMGHTGDMSARYSVNRGRIPASLVDEMRAAYKRCEPFLSTVPTVGDADRQKRTFEFLLRYAGVTEAELAKLDLDAMTNDEILAVAEAARVKAQSAPVRSGQKAVPISEVRPMLDAGWEYVAPLGPDQAVLRLPPSQGLPPLR